ncbi:Leucine Rich repeats (2 copies)/Leucine rich repeat [Novymonas esmeraldas]|uniref:Leucine Rich repeats (2 copies)/Leucine rich repeat n=1 Tax=Novymonas esmeraldas TaxID=1808958 RepID=A0AAW0EPU7_9TRYP
MSARASSLTSATSDANRSGAAATIAAATFTSAAAAAAQCVSSSPALIEQLRQRLTAGLHSQPELRDLLGLCAESNTWTVEEAMQRPDTITVMELFLLQVPRVPLVHFFPNLVTVKFMSIGLESMASFTTLTLVEELWLSDNNICVIEGLDNMTRLRRLYLQGNRIESLVGLPPLRHLRELWLSRNQLSALTHLTPLRKLRALYLSGNPLDSLENAFSKDMSHLHDVNLSGCHLSLITELRHLQLLPCLRHLWLLDPLFGDNPICRLNNYTTLTLALLGSLDSLDGAFVTAEQRALVESVLRKKESYYTMRAQMLDTQVALLARHAEAAALRRTQDSGKALLELQACLQPIEHELAERVLYPLGAQQHGGGGGGGGSLCRITGAAADTRSGGAAADDGVGSPLLVPTSTLEELARQLARAVDTREMQERTTMLRLAEATQTALAQAQLLKERLAVELHTAGNVRLESLAPEHEAYVAAAELMQDRFDTALFEERFGITGVTVTSVRRIVNRGLRLRFDDRVKELHVDLANPHLRSRFVGLFGPVPVTAQGQSTCLQHMLLSGTAARGAPAGEDGKRSSSVAPSSTAAFQPTPAEEGVPLTNSLFYADEARLLSCRASSRTATATPSRGVCGSPSASQQSCSSTTTLLTSSEASALCRGQVVLYRVYLGKTVHALGGGAGSSLSPPSSFLQQNGRVWRRDYGADTCAAYRLLPVATTAARDGRVASGATAPPLPSSYMWYCFDRALVLPDCVVDYTYSMPGTPLTQSPRSPAAAGAVVPLGSRAAAVALLTGAVSHAASTSNGLAAETAERHRATAQTDAVEDALRCGDSLLQFLHWCGPPSRHARTRGTGSCGNTMEHVAEAETREAVASVQRVVGKSRLARLLRGCAAEEGDAEVEGTREGHHRPQRRMSSGGSANPLQARHIEAYAAQVGVSREQPLSLCVLRSHGLTAVLQDFAASLCATITTLDLAHNSITTVSWFALAKEAPLLQRLNLSCNALARLHLDGSTLPALRVLDVSGNAITSVTDFATIRTAAAALEELIVHGNPFMQNADGQEAEARLWTFLLPPPTSLTAVAASGYPTIVKVNSHSLGAYPGTLAAQRFRRACLLPGGRATSLVTGVAAAVVRSVLKDGEVGAAGVFSVDGVTVPESRFEAAASLLEQLEAAGDVSAHLLDGNAALTGGGGDVPPSPSTSACLRECHTFCWSRGLLDDARGLAGLLPHLSHLTLRAQALTDIEPLLHLRLLESLNLAENRLTELPCLAELRGLRELVLDFNLLTSLPAAVGPLPALRQLSASGNKITHVDIGIFVPESSSRGGTNASPPAPPLLQPYSAHTTTTTAAAAAVPQLGALYLLHNCIADMNVIYALRDVPSLLILGVAGNPCTTVSAGAGDGREAVRPYLIHVLPQLKVLDGVSISATETAKAREAYAGKINGDLLLERARGPPETWAAVLQLNLSHCALKEVNLLEPFTSLEVLQLQHNLLTSVVGVTMLSKLTALDLSHNRLGASPWQRSSISGAAAAPGSTGANGSAAGAGTGATAALASSSSSAAAAAASSAEVLGDALAPLKRLQSLSLEANQLTDISALRLRLPHLKFLNLRGNELQFIQRGLEHLPELRELLLDQNKLRSLGTECFAGNKKLAIITAENNAIRSVEGLVRCGSLEQLRLGANRLGELSAVLHDLQACPLKAAVLVGNPIARKTNYRATVILRFTHLTELDRRAVTQEERDRAASTRMTELVAPPNVVIDMNYLAASGAGPCGPPGFAPPPPHGLHVSGAVASSGVVATGQPQLTGIRASIVPGKRGGAADRFAVNQRSRPYRR